MKLKKIIKAIFITVLSLILVGLSIIAFSDLLDNNDFKGIVPVDVAAYSNMNYKILDKSGEVCAQALDYFYSDGSYKYYFTCLKSGSIYLEWENGEITRMVDDLIIGRVTIESLIQHGLDVKSEMINE